MNRQQEPKVSAAVSPSMPSLSPPPSFNFINPRSFLLALSIIGLSLLSLIAYSFTRTSEGADYPGCRGVYMSPAYARVEGFDHSHTRFASKYSLYIYREQGKDRIPSEHDDLKLSGIPVLFIPGNAGSYKQVRSIASASANLYYENFEYIQDLNKNVNNLDFFSADFNEDFTAFHGRTMLDQAEYLNDAISFILSLYSQNEKPATSVILLGHSMGGIVSRVMMTLPNYIENSVNTIITLAAPHAAAPATFDGDLLSVFASTDDFWRIGFSPSIPNSKLSEIARFRLQNVSLISITGGLLDNMLPADYTSLTGLVPETNGFTVSTTGIPGVWSPIDHLAIVWCDQLRRTLAKTILQIVDATSNTQTYPLAKRMEIFRKMFLSGFEPKAKQDFDSVKASENKIPLTYKLTIDTKQLKETPRERTFQLPLNHKSKRNSFSPDIHLFYVGKNDLKFNFNFISSLKPTNIEELDNSPSAALLLCRALTANKKYEKEFDYTTDQTTKYVQLECIDIQNDVHMIPRSFPDSQSSSESSIGAKENPFWAVQLNSDILSNFDTVVIAESSFGISGNDFIMSDLELEQSSNLSLGEASLWKLFTRGYYITLPGHRPIIVDIQVPSAWSSLLAYRFDIRYEYSKLRKFSPVLSQSIRDETKWHINIDEFNDVTALIQGISPFCPFVKDEESSLQLKLFSDSLSSDQILDIYMTVDWFKSLKMIVLRYRLSIIGFPTFVTVLVLYLQFRRFIKDDIFPSFGEGLLMFCDWNVLFPVAASLAMLSSFVSKATFQKLLSTVDPVTIPDLDLMHGIEKSQVHVNMYFLGLEEGALWFYGPLILIISLALVSAFYFTLNGLITVISIVYAKFFPYKSGKPNVHGRRRALAVALLVGSIPFYLPYQFAYTVCCIVQLVVVIRGFTIASNHSNNSPAASATQKSFDNYKNFNLSILLIMLWILPVNIPVLIVWIHNFSLKWATPFSSHHNLLAILPILFLIQGNVNGFMITRPVHKLAIFFTKFILIYFSFYSLVFGTRHLFWIHHLLDLTCAWFSLILFDDWWNSRSKSIYSIRKEETSSKLH